MKRSAKLSRLLAWFTFFSIMTVAFVRAADWSSIANAPGKLPKTAVPIHYQIHLRPDLDRMTIVGSETVEIEVITATDRLVLNALNMSFRAAAVDGVQASRIRFDEKAETVTLRFPRPIDVGHHTLRISFSGRINDRIGGLSKVKREDGGRLLMSHLEPDEARQMFPCWDEPAFKATFELSATVPEAHQAFSNMPVASETSLPNALKRIAFQRTPPMSTYNLTLVAGEFERTSIETDGISITVVAAAGEALRARYALESAGALLKFYNEYTGMRYPLPKLDLIAIPGEAGEPVENWGAITFPQGQVLLEPSATSVEARRRVFMILAHEIAHQWFGDLVTMTWWNDLWLNEAFGTWMEAKTVEHLHPDWPAWLYAASNKQTAMIADSGSSPHPVRRNATTDVEIEAMFDVMTYRKGSALIRMIENHLGQEAFRSGIRLYLQRRAYGNSVPDDLWRSLEEASGQNVEIWAATYLEKTGVPLLIVESSCVDGRQRFRLKQDNLVRRDPEVEPQWPIPITFGPITDTTRRQNKVLNGSAEVEAGNCAEAVKLNIGNTGYYRVKYDEMTHAKLAKTLGAMSPADRVNFIADTRALVDAGLASEQSYETLVESLGDDADGLREWFARRASRRRARPEASR
jgi:aminopeptidase N